MKAKIIREYDAPLDSKNRITVRGKPKYKHYHVSAYKDGKITLEPRVLVSPWKRHISANPAEALMPFQ